MNSNIVVVHVQGAAVDPDYSYTGERQMAAYRKLSEICQQVGLPQDSDKFFSLGYDEVTDAADEYERYTSPAEWSYNLDL